ncbi:flagellar basal-body rod protein FlgF [Thalassococcus profundi]|uniref:Flagellar basal-body rod protein FlgF n=1 Tax=Thalassococcus profundi TaxID=2282382 RepID=A0A369TJA8_9RHOB|nr:flagellar basal-body rod protein FlgF [Thalassococcus profundi]RDD65431.1 flagellar basal-body rod protein FlgF [Thalassococcus profundi]
MTETTHIGMSLATSLQRQLDMTANNIANASTAGYKGEHMVFESLVQKGTPAGEDAANFVSDTGSYIDTRPGAMSQTGNPLDMALNGDGWFGYRMPDGQMSYGRDGSFTLDTDGNLTVLSGARVLDQGGAPIALPTEGIGALIVSEDGTISAEGTGPLARVGVFDIPEIQSYRRVGGGMLLPPDGAAAPTPAAATQVLQGVLELSNVNPIREMTRMIEVQRAYERTNALIGNSDTLRRDALRRIGQAV